MMQWLWWVGAGVVWSILNEIVPMVPRKEAAR